MFLDLTHSSLDIHLNSMNLLHSVLSINLSLWDLGKLSSTTVLSKLATACTDLVIPSLEATILLHSLSVVLWCELAAVTGLILSVEANSVLLVTESLAGLTSGEYHSG